MKTRQKTVMMTGATSGIGLRFAWLVLAVLVVACRGDKTGEKTETAAQEAEKVGFYDERAVGNVKSKGTADTQNMTQNVVCYELPAPLKDRPEQILQRRGYTTSYNSRTKNPNWVAWHLTKTHTYGKNQRSQEKFTEDADVKAPRATDQDYYTSRYDRGHMCPAGDNKWDKTAMEQSFLFTNICPQNHGLNKYEWNDLEILCREWAQQYGAVDIVCGPIYDHADAPKTIGRNKVWVPERLFKVVLCRKGKPKAIGFVYENEGRKQPMEKAVCTVDEIERLTGIDFFPALDDATENRVEAEARLADW